MSPNSPDTRVGDLEREQIAADLGRHMALGRLTLNELENRLDIAYTAKTRRQLDAVIRDLPSAEPATVPARSGGRDRTVRGKPSMGARRRN